MLIVPLVPAAVSWSAAWPKAQLPLRTARHRNNLSSLRNLSDMTGKFEPKVPVNLDPPKDDPISLSELSKANGKSYRHSSLSWPYVGVRPY